MISLTNAITLVQQANWTITSSFNVELNLSNSQMRDLVGWTASEDFSNILQLSIKNIDVPQHTADLVEKIIAGEWHISRNEDELYVVNITFRDMYSGSLYRIFKSIWNAGRYNYMDKSRFSLKITLVGGRKDTSNAIVFETEKMWMTSISQIQLSHENNEIMEFSVEFKTNEPTCDFYQAIQDTKGTVKTLSETGSTGAYTRIVKAAANRASSIVKDIASNYASKWGDVSKWDI